jgi:two-component system, NarL family, response regulator LiaR
MNEVRIALVDDHRVVTRSLKAYLESFPGFKVVGMAASGEELLDRLDEWRPQVVLQDLLLPGGIDGIETTRRIVERAPAVKVIALTASLDEARMMGVLRAGAAGYLRKDTEPETLLAAIRAVVRGKTYIDPIARAQLAGSARGTNELTQRKTEILRQLALGRSNKEVASALTISEETVKSHVAHVLSKLQVENRAQAAVQALKRGVISLEDLD